MHKDNVISIKPHRHIGVIVPGRFSDPGICD